MAQGIKTIYAIRKSIAQKTFETRLKSNSFLGKPAKLGIKRKIL